MNANAEAQFHAYNVLYDELVKFPHNKKAATDFRAMLRQFLPPWHFPMLQDKTRNEFYRNIIKDNVKGKTVLEIGMGSGLLSVMAAKYGAKHVFACEHNPVLYKHALETIKSSGVGSKITPFFASSLDLKLQEHIPEKVDVILSEIFGSVAFDEEVIKYLSDAKRFLRADGIFVPGKIDIFAVPASRSEGRGPEVKSFDGISLESFNFASSYVKWPSHDPVSKYKILGGAKKIYSMDFNKTLKPHDVPPMTIRSRPCKKEKFLLVFFEIAHGKHKLKTFSLKKGSRNISTSWVHSLFPLKNQGTHRLQFEVVGDKSIEIHQL